MEVDEGDLRHEFKQNKLSQYLSCGDRIYMSGIKLRWFVCILNKDVKGKGSLQVRDGEEWNYTKSGDISNVSQIHDDD